MKYQKELQKMPKKNTGQLITKSEINNPFETLYEKPC